MLPVEPSMGTGQPPSSPKLDSKLVTPASSAASTVASPGSRVVEVGGQLGARQRLGPAREDGADLRRVGHPGRVAEGDLLAAGGVQRPRQLGDARRVDAPS